MMQGDQYRIPIEILADDGVTDPTAFADVEIVIGSMRKTLANGEITYSQEDGCFLFPVSQKETMNLPKRVSAQLRVKLKGTDEVIGVDLGEIDIEETLSKAVL